MIISLNSSRGWVCIGCEEQAPDRISMLKVSIRSKSQGWCCLRKWNWNCVTTNTNTSTMQRKRGREGWQACHCHSLVVLVRFEWFDFLLVMMLRRSSRTEKSHGKQKTEGAFGIEGRLKFTSDRNDVSPFHYYERGIYMEILCMIPYFCTAVSTK